MRRPVSLSDLKLPLRPAVLGRRERSAPLLVGSTPSDQPRLVQDEFYSLQGPEAPWAWAEQHNRELTRRRHW